MIAKLFYLTSPAPDRYIINVQLAGTTDLMKIEIAECHLANVVADSAHYALRKLNRVPETTSQDSADERTGTQRTA